MNGIACLIAALLFCGCVEEPNPSEPDFSRFEYIDFDAFRRTSPDTTFDASLKTMIIRRASYKRGTMKVMYDTTMKEWIQTCSPLIQSGDTVCPTYYEYFLVDSAWVYGDPSEKGLHRIELHDAYLPDTAILDAGSPRNLEMVSEPSIPQLDRLVNALRCARIKLTKRRLPIRDGINYSFDVHGDLYELWTR